MHNIVRLLLLWSLTGAAQPNNIRCMNFYGLETVSKDLVCGWQHNPRWYLERLKYDMFINTIRLPFSYEYVREGQWTNMDKIINDCHLLQMRVILDYHRTYNTHQGPVPEEGISRQQFIDAWKTVLHRYYNYENVFGVGVFNEIQAFNDFKYTVDLHKEVVSALEAEFPDRFYYFLGCPNWGGNCLDMMSLRDLLPTVWNRTYIEVHKYSFSGEQSTQAWDISIPDTIQPNHWFIGEFGWKETEPSQVEWAIEFINYLKSRGIYNACAWTIAHSGDTNGWWNDDCETFNWDKAEILTRLWYSAHRNLRSDTVNDIMSGLTPPESLTEILRLRNDSVAKYDFQHNGMASIIEPLPHSLPIQSPLGPPDSGNG